MYADYKDQTNQTFAHILGSFLHQFLTIPQIEPIPDEITQKLHHIQHQRGKLGVEDTLALLKIRLDQLKCAFICIDAVDELEPQVQQQLLNVLKDLGTNNTRLFLTGRQHIESEIQKCFQVEDKYRVIISPHCDDIQEFLLQQIRDDVIEGAMDEVLKKNIISVINRKSQDM